MRTRRILLVEDDAGVAEALQGFITDLLERECVYVRSADDALEVIEREDVQLVLSDIMLPQHNGFWLLDAVRERHPEIPVLLMSGWYDEAERAKHVQPRLPVLYKPFGIRQLEYAIKMAERLIETASDAGRTVSELARTEEC